MVGKDNARISCIHKAQSEPCDDEIRSNEHKLRSYNKTTSETKQDDKKKDVTS